MSVSQNCLCLFLCNPYITLYLLVIYITHTKYELMWCHQEALYTIASTHPTKTSSRSFTVDHANSFLKCLFNLSLAVKQLHRQQINVDTQNLCAKGREASTQLTRQCIGVTVLRKARNNWASPVKGKGLITEKSSHEHGPERAPFNSAWKAVFISHGLKLSASDNPF